MDHSLSGKIALVTGGTRGIGFETSRGLGKRGASVVIGARREAQARAAAERLEAEGLDVQPLKLDVTDDDDRSRAFDYLVGRYGVLDILINNAGLWLESDNAATPPAKPGSLLSPEVLRRTFDVNFFGPVLLTQRLLPLLRNSQSGRIVNVSSIRGSLTLQSDPTSPVYPNKALAYDTSKTALNAFTVQIADELRGSNIKANAIHPGWVRTEMGGEVADLDIAEGARTTIMFASLPDDGPTGGFFYLDERLPW